MNSPTSRSLAAIREDGWTVQVVERWNPHSRTRLDLFGFADLLAIRPGRTLAVQTTSASNASARILKTLGCPGFAAAVNAGWRIEVHGWSKKGPRGKRKTWQCRVEVLAAGRPAVAVPPVPLLLEPVRASDREGA